MSFNQPKIDTHIHTEGTAPYKKGDSNLKPYHKRGREKGLEIMCITDHYHYITQDPRYLFNQRKHIDEMKYSGPAVLLGTEQTILGKRGRLAIRRNTRSILDMINISIHWFGVGMPGLFWGTTFGTQDLKKISKYVRDDSEKANKLFRFISDSYVNALQSKKIEKIPTILGHPWDNFLARGLFFKNILEETRRIVKIVRETNAAFEFNDGTCAQLINYMYSSNDDAIDFLVELVGILNDHEVWISFASDAHQISDIGNLEHAKRLLIEIGKKTSTKSLKMVNSEFLNLS